MRKIRFIGHQIIAVLKSVEAGRTIKDVCRKASLSRPEYAPVIIRINGLLT